MTSIQIMRITRRPLWLSALAACCLSLLVVGLVCGSHYPRPELTRAIIFQVQWALQTQSVK